MTRANRLRNYLLAAGVALVAGVLLLWPNAHLAAWLIFFGVAAARAAVPLLERTLNRVYIDWRFRRFEKIGRMPSQYDDLLQLSMRDLRSGVEKGSTNQAVDAAKTRVKKVRELSSVLFTSDVGLAGERAREFSDTMQVALTDTIRDLARRLKVEDEYGVTPGPATAADFLKRIIETREDTKGKLEEVDLEAILKDHPVSLEEVNELLIAAVYALALRLEAQQDPGIK